MTVSKVSRLLQATVMWTGSYLVLCKSWPGRSREFHCRTVTVLHAFLVISLSCWCLFVQGPWPFTDAGGQNTPLQDVTVTLCLGYFVFDFCWCVLSRTEGPTMLFHHILSIGVLGISFFLGHYGTEVVATIFGGEITNPLLQLRWFLKKTGRYKTGLGEIVDLAFLITFGSVRIGVGSYMLYCYFRQPNTPAFMRAGACAMYAVSWIFWISILQFAFRKYSQKYKQWNTRFMLKKTNCNKLS